MEKQKKPPYLERLAARPIMIYPRSQEQRRQIEKAAKAHGQGLSPFVLETVLGMIAPDYWSNKERAKVAEIAAREETVRAARQRMEEAKARLHRQMEDESAVA